MDDLTFIVEWCFQHDIKINFHYNSLLNKREIMLSFRVKKVKHLFQYDAPEGADFSFILYEFIRFAHAIDPNFYKALKGLNNGK